MSLLSYDVSIDINYNRKKTSNNFDQRKVDCVFEALLFQQFQYNWNSIISYADRLS